MGKSLIISILIVSFLTGCIKQDQKSTDYPILPVPFTQVKLTDDFWAPRIETNSRVTIPIAFRHCETTGRIKNFEIAGGLAPGSFCTLYPFDDSDVFKIIEGASYALHNQYDPELDAYLDSLIFKIAAAQEDDGYLYTNRTINPDSAHPWAGTRRWELVHELSHELYNVGHMYEAAVAHYLATGKRTFLDVAIKNADLVYNDFGWGRIEDYPGHQEIEIGLVKLYRVTGDRRYLDLARFFLDVRGPDGEEYNQAHRKVVEQTEAVGHAVRACYMYSAMADVAALTGDPAYGEAISRIWENVVTRKYYITGGIGQTGSNEGFGPDYDLPNLEAYCETCASIAMVFWNHRLFLMKGDARYIDVMERTMYNALLSGVALTGDLFFYPNPLASDGRHKRKEWFGCACCPSNICRFLPSLPGYIYGVRDRELFVNLYISNEASIEVAGTTVAVKQETRYPWEGNTVLLVDPDKPITFTVNLRIPGWAQDEPVPGDLYTFVNGTDSLVKVIVNGEEVPPIIDNGYAKIARKWRKGDRVGLVLPMPVRKIRANEKIEADRGKIALQRGPLVYCLEGIDQPGGSVVPYALSDTATIIPQSRNDLMQGIITLHMPAIPLPTNNDDQMTMNNNLITTNNNQITTNNNQITTNNNQITTNNNISPPQLTAIPYCYWANRGSGEMEVWIPEKIE